jgi:hypothetical protein
MSGPLPVIGSKLKFAAQMASLASFAAAGN